jgi:hypothetical protein
LKLKRLPIFSRRFGLKAIAFSLPDLHETTILRIKESDRDGRHLCATSGFTLWPELKRAGETPLNAGEWTRTRHPVAEKPAGGRRRGQGSFFKVLSDGFELPVAT